MSFEFLIKVCYYYYYYVIKKCTNKFDCLVNEMLCIQDLKPTLNVQSDSLRVKVFM